MDEREFHGLVNQADAVSEPEPITRATLETLGDALASGQADEVAKWLPAEYAELLGEADDEAESIEYEAFLDRVRERGGDAGDADELRARVGAVADALATTVPHDELLDVRSQLPDRIGSLFTEKPGAR